MKKIILLFVTSLLFVAKINSQGCAPNCTLYTGTTITPVFSPTVGTFVSLSDDQVSGGCPIGFTFTFFCNAYNTFYISSNGFISFNPSVSNGCCSGVAIPSPGNAVNNFIAFDWNDLYPPGVPGGGGITYYTTGVAPNRICIISYTSIPHCCNFGPAFNSGQIKLYESTNSIDILNAVVTTDGSSATQGIMNQAGTIAYPIAGRNGVSWTGSSNATRFTVAGGGPTAPGPISGSVSVCPGSPYTYSVPAVVGALSYSWNLPGGWTGTSVSNSIVGTPGSSGTISVTATYTCGTSPITTLAVTVNTLPIVTITGGTTALCAGYTVGLTGNGANTYSWNTGALTNSIVVTPSVNTTYSVIGTSAQGCTGTAVQNVTVNPGPTVTITGPLQLCIGGTLNLTANGAMTYSWSTGALTQNIATTPTINTTYTVLGTNTITGCAASATQAVAVNALPIITIAGANTLCAGSPLTLTASGGNTYTWSPGGVANPLVVSPTVSITYSVTGTNSVTGCSNTAAQSITVNAVPSVTVTGPYAMCLTQTVNFTAFGAPSYSWSTGSTSSVIAISPTVNTTYTVYGTSPLGCGSSAVVKSITVNPIPVVTANATSTLICKGETVLLTAGGVDTYSWNTGALTPTISSSPSVNITYTVTGTNTTTGCYNDATVTIFVSPCTGVNQISGLQSAEIKVYPNPHNGEFVVELSNGLNKTIEVYDLMGRTILNNSSEEDKLFLNISEFSNGIYYVKIISNNTLKVVKIIKQ